MMKTNSPPFDLIPEESSADNVGAAANAAAEVVAAAVAARSRAAAVAEQAALILNNSSEQQQGGGGGGRFLVDGSAVATFQDFALQQHMLQVKHQQLIQRQILEHQIQKNREIMQVQHERQITALMHQAQMKKVQEDQEAAAATAAVATAAAAAAASEHDRQERLRLEILRQKSSNDQSAVASPEVKRHLQEFVLQKKRKEAAASCAGGAIAGGACASASSAASMGNLKLVPTGALGGHSAPQPILRKTASESNLLKMKSKRALASGGAAPYYRQHHPACIPESASKSQNNSPPVELSYSFQHDLVVGRASNSSSPASSSGPASASTSPKTHLAHLHQQQQQHHHGGGGGIAQGPKRLHALSKQQRSLDGALLGASTLNSKSLPNIASAVGRLQQGAGGSKEGLFARHSPPPSSSSGASGCSAGVDLIVRHHLPPPHHGAMIVRRSKSSAILPLRKHLIEKSLHQQDKKAMDEEQFYYQQKQIARERLMIRPIEEVMEEDCPKQTSEGMEVDGDQAEGAEATSEVHQHYHSFTARLGPLGLSPLVRGEVSSGSSSSLVGGSGLGGGSGGISNDYVTRLLPRQPLNLASVHNGGDQTGLGYDPLMLKHQCICEDPANHPENPARIMSIWNRLVESGLSEKCVRVARRATLEEIQSCHSETHTLVYGTDMVNRCSLTGSQELHREARMGKFCRLDCGGIGVDSDTYWNELETPAAVRTAVGTLIELSQKVARQDLRNGFAIIRPPGHHAELEEAMGFCYFNAVAIAAKQLLLMPGVRRILIIDWAIHHGNGTQKAFYDNPNVLYISLHRHDNGNFYPGTGGPVECGTGAGLGFNINIAWAGGLDPPMGDAEYLAAFRSVVMPVARSYDPDIVLVSAGFDAAAGHPHPIGGYLVSTACFAYMTLQLRQLARGRVVLALEGGFNLDVLAEASEQCVRALLGLPIEKISECELARRPGMTATETLQKTLAIHTPYWDVLRRSPESALLSHLEAWEKSREESEALSAMACLSVDHQRGQQQQQQLMQMRGSSCGGSSGLYQHYMD